MAAGAAAAAGAAGAGSAFFFFFLPAWTEPARSTREARMQMDTLSGFRMASPEFYGAAETVAAGGKTDCGDFTAGPFSREFFAFLPGNPLKILQVRCKRSSSKAYLTTSRVVSAP